MASASGSREIVSSHKVHITADALAEEVDYSGCGHGGAARRHPRHPEPCRQQDRYRHLRLLCKERQKGSRHLRSTQRAGISRPAGGQKSHGARRFQDKLAGAEVLDTEVVVDGNITTSYGLGGAIPLRWSWCASWPGRLRPTASRTPSPTATEGGSQYAFCHLPPAGRHGRSGHSFADGTQVWPLSWLGFSYETLSDAIPFLTPQVRAGLQLAIAGIPALPVEAVHAAKPPFPARRRMWCALASTTWPTRTKRRNTLPMPLQPNIRMPFTFPSGFPRRAGRRLH